ncbi:MAG: class I SAM-dependent methyltransferase, partial [bacterium]|nr:class I SAM-dependent methyltransferase [bacterium]
MYKSEKFWDRTSKSFDKPGIEYGKIFIKSIENIKKHLDSSDIVLDYACATGAITNEIAGDVKEVHGIDISSKMLVVAKRKAAERTIKNVEFKQSTLSGAGYQKEAFNVILGFNILHLLEDAG